MLEAHEIVEKGLREGRDYIYIGGVRYRPEDCLLQNGQELIVKQIYDPVHFSDRRNFCLHSHMFFDQNWEHCPERNADKKTEDRTQYAVIADRVRIERENFRNSQTQSKPYQVYDNYERIYFWEKMSWHLIERERKPDSEESAALLKKSDEMRCRGATLLEDMHRHFVFKCADLGSKFDLERFVTDYIDQQQVY
ncbi:MAG: hypothetical protein LBC13_01775 [Clostridiales bacterium]|jgi:hypothetical protein|nr:hypothetical protein [Clostridiales bacterium]